MRLVRLSTLFCFVALSACAGSGKGAVDAGSDTGAGADGDGDGDGGGGGDRVGLDQEVDDQYAINYASAETSVQGRADVTSSTLSGELNYQSMSTDGSLICDFELELSGVASSRCPDCDMAFDISTTFVADASLPDCAPNPMWSLLDGTIYGYDTSNPGLGWIASRSYEYEYAYDGYTYSLLYDVSDVLVGLVDISDPYYGGLPYTFQRYLSYHGTYSYYYNGPYYGPYTYSGSVAYQFASLVDGELEWSLSRSEDVPQTALWDSCGSATTGSAGPYIVARTDLYARDTLPCATSSGDDDYGDSGYYGGTGYYYDDYYGGYGASTNQRVDAWTVPAATGDLLTVQVDTVDDSSAFDNSAWLNGPDACTEAVGGVAPCAHGEASCASLRFEVFADGDHQIVVRSDSACPSGVGEYKLKVQKD